MWFWLSVTALLCWSGSDLFSKIGCCAEENKSSHLKMLTAVGLVMGLHALFEIFVHKTVITAEIIFTYLPVSALYISSMLLGYISLRYIELSVSSPICNSSGVLVAIAVIITGGIHELRALPLIAVVLITFGIVGLGFTEAHEDEELRRKRQEQGNRKYAKSVLAILLPILYCILDALGTYADSRVLETIPEDSANIAYELTFAFVGVTVFIIMLVTGKFRFEKRRDGAKLTGAVFETAGQMAYIYAIADSEHVMYSAPMISAYCTVSVLWGRIFLKEKLTAKHYLMLLSVIIGIVILGITDI